MTLLQRRIQRSIEPAPAVHVLAILTLALQAGAVVVGIGHGLALGGVKTRWQTHGLEDVVFFHVFCDLDRSAVGGGFGVLLFRLLL